MIENVKCVKSCDVFVREDGGQMCQLFAGFFFCGCYVHLWSAEEVCGIRILKATPVHVYSVCFGDLCAIPEVYIYI